MKRIALISVIFATASVAYAQSEGSSYYGTGLVDGGTLSANDLDINRPHIPGHNILRTNYHTGLSFSAHSWYGGIRFYNQGYLPTVSNPYDSTAGAIMVMSIIDGNVGIGTTNPGDKLVISDGGTNAISIRAGETAGIGFNRAVTGGGIYNNAISAWQFSARDSMFTLEGYNGAFSSPWTVLKNGNVGIGTISPTRPLDVVSDAPYGVRVYRTVSNSGMLLGADNAGAVLSSTGIHIIRFYTSDEEQLRINASGNVGIGTTIPTEKLSVNGKIRAKEVIVETTGWSDYVFDENHKLQSLADVEQHIKTEKHLPGVPSAKEVAANGVSVGDMQAILLAKIEELTLHVIRQEKTLAEATAKIEAQQAEIVRLKATTK